VTDVTNVAAADAVMESDFVGEGVLYGDGSDPQVWSTIPIRESGGILYHYDSTRSAWLSVARMTFGAAKIGNAGANDYLKTYDSVNTNQDGDFMARAGRVVTVVISADNVPTNDGGIRLYKNGSNQLTTLYDGANSHKIDTTADVSFAAGDRLSYRYTSAGTTKANDAKIWIEVQWEDV